MLRRFTVTLTLLFLARALAAQTLLVPSQFASIQAALNAAAPGDTVLVSPGTYVVNSLSFNGKAVTLKSTGGPTVTILDAQNLDRVMVFAQNEGPGTVVDGFRIYRGKAGFHLPGGGMYCYEASPTIKNCVFLNNVAGQGPNALFRRGGALLVASGAPTFTNCSFQNNVAGPASPVPSTQTAPGAEGGAFFLFNPLPGCSFTDCSFVGNQTSPAICGGFSTITCGVGASGGAGTVDGGTFTMTRCTFNQNSTVNADGVGGALKLRNCTATLTNCVLTSNSRNAIGADNSNLTVDGSRFVGNTGSFGAAIQANSGILTCNGSIFESNQAGGFNIDGQTFGYWGGAVSSIFAQLSIRNCVFRQNAGGNSNANLFSPIGPAEVGVAGAIYCEGSQPTLIENCEFTQNRWGLPLGYGAGSTSDGGTILASGTGPLNIRHCSFFDSANLPYTVSSLIAVEPFVQLTIENSIIWQSGPTPIATNLPAVVTYSNIEGGYPGTGNINVDPLFVRGSTGDLHLAYGSPCIDAGTSAIPLPATDRDGEPRTLDAAPDMGADEFLRMGSADDIVLTTTVNGGGSPSNADKSPSVGDTVTWNLRTPGGSFSGLPALFVIQIYGIVSPPLPNMFYPFVFIETADPFTYDVILSLSNATAPQYQAVIPPGFAGQVIRTQGVVVDPSTANGIFGASAAHDVRLP